MATQQVEQQAATKLTPEKLSQLTQKTRDAFARVQKLDQSEVTRRMNELKARAAEVEKITDKNERDVRLQILNSDRKSVQELNRAQTVDIAQVMLGAHTIITSMGIDLEEKSKDTPEDTQMLADAQDRLKKAEEFLQKEQGAWINRESRVAKAEEEIELAKENIQNVISEVGRRKRARIDNASLEANLQDFIVMTESCTAKLKANIIALGEANQSTILTKNETYDEKMAKAQEVRDCETQVGLLNGELSTMEIRLRDLVAGEPDYVDLERQISDKKTELDTVDAQMQAALGVFNSAEKKIKDQESAIRTQQKQIGHENFLVQVAESDIRGIIISMQNRLVGMKSASLEEAGKILGQIGTEAILKNMEAQISYGVVSDNNIAEIFEGQKTVMARIAVMQGAENEHQIEFKKRFEKIYDDFRKDFGIVPFKWSSDGSSSDGGAAK